MSPVSRIRSISPSLGDMLNLGDMLLLEFTKLFRIFLNTHSPEDSCSKDSRVESLMSRSHQMGRSNTSYADPDLSESKITSDRRIGPKNSTNRRI